MQGQSKIGMPLVSIAMYLTSRPLAEATAELWSFLRRYLLHAGLMGLPETLDQSVAYDEAWLRPDLLLSQTCGYPFATSLRGRVRLVATPVYSHPDCDGPLMRSFIIVRKNSSLRVLEDLRGTTAAINSHNSNSGRNLFRAAVAPLARNGRLFERIIETGSHGGSIAAPPLSRAGRKARPSIVSLSRISAASIPPRSRASGSSPKRPRRPVCRSSHQAAHRAKQSSSSEERCMRPSESRPWRPRAPRSDSLISRCSPKGITSRSSHLPAMHCRS
ncbi:NMT1-like domain-containing protein (plasmid) [Rhizobium etli bv. mimosae str. Mim1]|nr:NMT1-like domain-containing protein [Rhizobium etli bv. mimosae str. Mim1]